MSLIDEYRFDGGWKAMSGEGSGAHQPERPAIGRRVRLTDGREGKVVSVDSRGALMRLTIDVGDGATERLVYAPGRITILPDSGED